MIPYEHLFLGTCAILTNKEGRIFLMKRAKECIYYPDHWGLVGGLIEIGETVEEALIREAQEEIGVEIGKLEFVGRYYNTPHPIKKVCISLPHRAEIISGTPSAHQPEECSDVNWFTAEEIRGMELAYDHKKILADEGLI